MSPPLAQGSAPLEAHVIETLKLEIAKRGMNADRLRKRLSPPVSGATFWRAMHGQKVSKPVQDACAAMARTIREQGHSRLESGHTQVLNSKAYTLSAAEDIETLPDEYVTYDFDPDPEAA